MFSYYVNLLLCFLKYLKYHTTHMDDFDVSLKTFDSLGVLYTSRAIRSSDGNLKEIKSDGLEKKKPTVGYCVHIISMR